MSLEIAGKAVKQGLGLQNSQVRLLIRVGWVLIVTTFMLWASGVFAFLGMGKAPYAFAEEMRTTRHEVSAVKGDVTSIKLQLLEETLFDVRLKQCKAETPESKQYYFEKLQEKMNLYWMLTQRNWRAPECKEIL